MSFEIGVIAGILGVSGFIYQTWKNPNGMTFPMIGFVGISIGLWAGYGISIGDAIIYTPNLIMLLLLLITGMNKMKLRKLELYK